RFDTPLVLLFPAIVQAIHVDVCVEVEFDDGETAYVPTTLVEQYEPSVGDLVYTCTSYLSHGTNPQERCGPCPILNRDGDRVLLQDDAGTQFEAATSMVAVPPARYRSTAAPVASGDVHVIRTDHWLNADDDPITKAQVDDLLAADPELAWAPVAPA